jgi:glycosyltransferase involved in cell wall biosynthesis
VADLMRASDALVLPTLEEGSALVTAEARACGCVLLVSNASGAICSHQEDALVHQAGDVEALSEHIALLYSNPELVKRLRSNSLKTIDQITWTAAGERLLRVYREVIARYQQERSLAEPAGGPNPSVNQVISPSLS